MKFTELLDENGITYLSEGDRHCREGWVQLACPFCKRAGFYMGYNLVGNYVNCYYCGYHRLGDTVMELLQVPWPKAKELLEGLEHTRPVEKLERRGKLELPKGLGPLAPAHERYLKGRGYDPAEIVARWHVLGIGLSSKLAWRVFIPIEYHGETVSWTTRSIKADATLRYISASAQQEAVDHKTLLYGEDLAKHAVCVVEGPMGAWKIGPGGVATFGTQWKQAQILRLARFPVRGVCYDNEPTAQRRAKKLCDALSVFPGETINFCLDSADPGEATPRELQSIRRTLGL